MNLISGQYALTSGSQLSQSWRKTLPALTLLVAWMLWLYRDTAIAMVTIWARSETFTHGFLVPPIVLWLVWRQRRVISAQTPQPTVWVYLPIVCVSFLWLLGDLAAVNALTQLAFTAMLVLAVPAVLGLPIARLIIFPLGFLFFAVPIGEFVMPQLMAWTANFTVFALRLSGIPVYREGLQFVIPSGNWSVVEACSGVRYLIASLTVGTLFAYLNYRSNKRRLLFVIVSLVVPVFANWMRAYIIVMLGHLSGNKLATGVDHLIYGWLFFGVVIMLMFIIGARWAEPEETAGKSPSHLSPHMQTVATARLWTMTICTAVLVTLPHIALWAIDRGEGAGTVQFTTPAVLAPSWQAADSAAADFKPAFQNPSAEINSSYARQGSVVGLYLGYYHHQDYNRKLVSSDNVLVVSKDPQWAQVASASRKVTFGGQTLAIRTAELRGTALAEQGNQVRLAVWRVYWINGSLTSSDYLAKAYSAFYRLIGRDDESAVIIVYTPTSGQAGGAEEILESFLSNNYAAINEMLLKVRPYR